MTDQKPLFKAPYDIKDVSVLFMIVAFVLIIAAFGNNLFGIFKIISILDDYEQMTRNFNFQTWIIY